MTFDRINGLNEGIAIKAPVLVATTAHIAHTGLQTIDGVAVPADARVLDKNNNNPILRGIWNASATAWSRALDFNGDRDIVRGTQVYVTSGGQGGSTFIVTTASPVIGSSALAFIASTYIPPQGFATVAAMNGADALGAGDTVWTQGFYAAGDGGGATYLISATGPATYADHALSSGLFAILLHPNNVFICEQYGIGDVVDNSARIQAANDDALIVNDSGAVTTMLLCSTSCSIQDQISFGGGGAQSFNIDFRNVQLNVVTGGDIGAATPAVHIQANNSLVYLPAWLELNKLGAGFEALGCNSSKVFAGFANRYIGFGHKLTGVDLAGGMTYYNADGIEWAVADTEFDTEANFLYDGLIVDTNDIYIVGARPGWANRNIYITSNAGNVRFRGCHPFQGNAKGGAFRPVEPISVENDSSGSIFFDDCYFDNGYIYDNTNRMVVGYTCRQFIVNAKVNMTRPYIRVVPQEADPDLRFQMFNMMGPATIGFYDADHVTPSPLWTWLDANPTYIAGKGSAITVTGKQTHVSVSSANEPDFIGVKRGTVPYWEQYVTNQAATLADDVIDAIHGGGRSRFSGGLLSNGKQGMGYGADAHDIQTQLTNKSTGVTSTFKACRIIMNNAALGAGASVSFTYTNAGIDLYDTVMVMLVWDTDDYSVGWHGVVGGGSIVITVTNITGGSLSNAVNLNVNIFKGAGV